MKNGAAPRLKLNNLERFLERFNNLSGAHGFRWIVTQEMFDWCDISNTERLTTGEWLLGDKRPHKQACRQRYPYCNVRIRRFGPRLSLIPRAPFSGAVKHSPTKRLRNASAVAVSGKQNRMGLLCLVPTPATADWDASVTVERIDL